MEPPTNTQDHQALQAEQPEETPRQPASSDTGSEQVPPQPGEQRGDEKAGHDGDGAQPFWRLGWWTLERVQVVVGLAFDGIVAVATVAGVILLLEQLDQTEQALNDGRFSAAQAKLAADAAVEANRLERAARLDDKADAIDAAQRDARMVDANEASAKAAQDSVAAQREGIRQEQRAFVVAGPPETLQEPTAERPTMTIRVPWTNVGRTSARKVTTKIGTGYAVDETATDVRGIGYRQTQSVSAMHPTVPFFTTVDWRFREPDLNNYLQGRTHIVIHGRVEYEDMFGSRWWVEFCGFRKRGESTFHFCLTGNDFGGLTK